MNPDDLGRWLELEDLKFRAGLIQARIETGLTLDDLAVAAGRRPEGLLSIEDLTTDPTLGMIRRYAAACGIILRHRVIALPAPPDEKAEPSVEADVEGGES